jgi:SAM-dependent methyltransferase
VDARDEPERRRLSFGAAADLYDSARPSYPPDAARWMLGEAPCRVADIGAGTGIFTRVLAELGHDVLAVEPDERMRRRLLERNPGIVAVAGSAESLPLPDASLDAVTAAQAHHWFANDGAHEEIARVLRPGGVFARIGNRRDESVDWVAELGRRAHLADGTRSGSTVTTTGLGPRFGPPEQAEFRHSTMLDRHGLIALVRSRSEYLVASEEKQRWIVEAIHDLVDRLPERFELPYVTVAMRAVRI